MERKKQFRAEFSFLSGKENYLGLLSHSYIKTIVAIEIIIMQQEHNCHFQSKAI